MSRQPNGHATIRRDPTRGRYEAKVTVRLPNGKKVRKNVRARTATDVANELTELRDRARRRAGVIPGKIETLGQWLMHWNDTIIKPEHSWKYWDGNRSMIQCHLIPHLGDWRLDGKDRLEPEYVTAMFAELREKGLSGKYLQNIFTCLDQALKVAHRQGKAPFNVCDMLDRPTARKRKIRPLKTAHARAVIREAMADEEFFLRWLFGIILGLRQGEVLGLRWSHVHLDPDDDEVPHVELRKQTQRRTWRHGCENPRECARPHCENRKPCPKWEHGCDDPNGCTKTRTDRCPKRRPAKSCYRHKGKNGCPPACPPECTGHAASCPQRTGGGLVETDLKTEESEDDGLPLGDLTELVRQHRERQIKAFAAAGLAWPDRGHVFIRWIHDRHGTLVPRQLDPRQDHAEWEALLVRAGVPDARLHAMRHTAGSVGHAAGVPIEIVSDNLRHASTEVTKSFYVQTAQELRRDAINTVAAVLMDGDLSALLKAANAKIG